MEPRRPSLAVAATLACGSLAFWVSLGAMTFVRASPGAAYVGILPPLPWLVGFLAIAAAITLVVRPAFRDVAPVWLSSALLLPWLPLNLSPAVFVWTGPVALWLSVAIATALAAPALIGRITASPRFALSPRRSALAAAVIGAAVYGWAAWATAPQHPFGDEPHYLVIAQSLIEDRDLKIENNHQQGDYRAYFGGPLKPDFVHRGQDGEIYSIHAPGLPVIVAPAFAAIGYPGAILTLLLVSAAASGLAWIVAWRVTEDRASCWFAWAATTLSAPFLLHATAIYPDGLGAAITLGAVLPLVDARAREPKRLVLVGAALAMLPWLHSRFAVLAAASAAVIAGRIFRDSTDRARRLAALAVGPVLGAVAWFSYFEVIYGVPNPSAQYGGVTNTSVVNVVRGLPGVLFDQQFGLLANAPVLLCAVAGIGAMFWRGRRRLAIELCAIVAPYFLLVTFFYMWWGGVGAPARFLVPITLTLVVPTGVWYRTRTTLAARVAGIGALLASVLVTLTMCMVERGLLASNTRDGASRLAGWLSPTVDLTTALPSLFQSPPEVAAEHIGVWLLAVAVAVAVAMLVERRLHHLRGAPGARHPGLVVLAFGVALEVTTMGAIAFVWRSNHAVVATPYASAQTVLRRYDPDTHQIALAYRPFHRLDLAALPGRLTLANAPSAPAGGDWLDLDHLPAGVYEVAGRLLSSPAGHLRVMTDRDLPIATWEASSFGPTWSRRVVIPVALAGLRVDGDADARRTLRDVSIRAVSVLGSREVPDGREARHGARFGSATAFLVGGSAWVEPDGAWVGGAANADFVIAPDAPSSVRLFLRNGAADNQVRLESGAWREDLALRPGEEQTADIPLERGRRSVLLKVASARGVRPSDVDPQSADRRLLGVWIETR